MIPYGQFDFDIFSTKKITELLLLSIFFSQLAAWSQGSHFVSLETKSVSLAISCFNLWFYDYANSFCKNLGIFVLT